MTDFFVSSDAVSPLIINKIESGETSSANKSTYGSVYKAVPFTTWSIITFSFVTRFASAPRFLSSHGGSMLVNLQ